MPTFNKLFVVDEDCTRRAAIAFELSKGGYSVLPLEDPNELFQLPPGGAPILVHDNGSAVPKAKELARKRECWSPLVAFDEVCDSQRVAAAAMEGARDYLIWPFSHADVEKSIERSHQWNGNIANWKVRYEASADKVRNLNLRERERSWRELSTVSQVARSAMNWASVRGRWKLIAQVSFPSSRPADLRIPSVSGSKAPS